MSDLSKWAKWKLQQSDLSDEDRELALGIQDLISKVGSFKEAFVRERNKVDILKRGLEQAKRERQNDNNVAMRWRDERDEMSQIALCFESQLRLELEGRDQDTETMLWLQKERERLIGLLGKVQADSVALILENEQFREKLENAAREIYILRQYGNKNCTAMADEALANPEEDT